MSGHNKWSKIKRKKEASDAAKSKVFSKHARIITMEARRVKGDVHTPLLAALIERAKRDSMPKENIDRAIQKGKVAQGAELQEIVYEAFGPGGTAIIVSVLTDNANRTTPEIRHIFKEAGYSLGGTGSAIWAFTKTAHGYTPQNRVELTDEDGEKLGNLIESLEEQEDVQDVYTTADHYAT